MTDSMMSSLMTSRGARRLMRGGLALFVAASTACAAAPADAQARHGAPSRDIVETAIAADDFSTLVAAVQAAGLVETLQGDGPFTVFAPTDEAFAALPDGTLESLLLPENRETLVSILTYHVVPGRVTAEQVVQLDEAETVNGADVRIRTRGGTVLINDSRVLTTDVMASNGVIHIIDQVLLPPEVMSAARSGIPEHGRGAARNASRRSGESRSDRGRMERIEQVRGQEARGVLLLALDRGVPLFNRGLVDGTAYIYEVALRSILAGDFNLPRRVERTLERAVDEGSRTISERERAWVYRDAIDSALQELGGSRMASRDRH